MATRLSAALVLFAVACSAPDETAHGRHTQSSEAGHFSGTFVPSPDPPTTGENALMVTLTGATGSAITGAQLDAEPWMPSMGHGSPVKPSTTEIGAGEYRIEDLSYTMPGKWEVRVDVSAGGVTDRFGVGLDVN